MQPLKVALVQTNLHWEDKQVNFKMLDEKLTGITTKPDIIVLPEMFSTGFSMQPEKFAEKIDGESVNLMQQKASQLNAVITGSLIIEENGAFYNRLIWMQPDGNMSWYDKRHLFSMAGEEKVYFPGQEKLVVEWKGWKICPLICYDLRFPVWIRNKECYDLLIFVANWPERRVQHWRKLLAARAIENECFVVGVNRVGEDGNKIYHSGSSMAVNPMGEILLEAVHTETIANVELNPEEITKMRRYMPFLKDMDDFKIKI